MRIKIMLFVLFIYATHFLHAQSLEILTSGKNISFRGLSVVNEQVLWASGTNGTVVRSIDGGKTFEWLTVKGFEQSDFRDIEALDENVAYIMAVDSPGLILKTTDAGNSWTKVYVDTMKGVFLDAMAFNQKGDAIVVGDPLADLKTYMVYKNEHQSDFKKLKTNQSLLKGEAFFAASGTNIQFIPGTDEFVSVTGGMASRFHHHDVSLSLPLMQGTESSGANSIAIWDNKNMYVVGGDFSNDTISTGNACFTKDGGLTWQRPNQNPHGYRSCVIYLTANKLLACGTSGVDISTDGGLTWESISTLSYHVCQISKSGKAVFLAGTKGRITKLIFWE
ncbi:MAG: oxidoreductase [Bacteroidetes bacterium]|nr:oxidoreductase [Bacteroidota bacterium]